MASSPDSRDHPLAPSLAEYLTLDIQNSPEWAQELADQIEAIRQGQLDHWERLGNAYELTLTPKGAAIADAINETAAVTQVSLEDLAAAVQEWIAQLEALPEGKTNNAP